MATRSGCRRGWRPRPRGFLASARDTRRFQLLRVAAQIVGRAAATLFGYRVTGLAAEATFWALLSMPPLLLGVIGLLGHFRAMVGAEAMTEIRALIVDNASLVLTDQTVEVLVAPLVEEVFRGGSADIISVGFVISLWSGSRALNVYVDAITISYGLAGHRGIIKTRALAFGLYLAGLVTGMVVLPLLVAGPTVVTQLIPGSAVWVQLSYWPLVVALGVAFVTSLYSLSVPVRTAWWRDLPGAAVAVAIWMAGSAAFRTYLAASFSESTVYGSLSAPVVVLIWLYLTAWAVLVGAAINAEIDRQWPSPTTAAARATHDDRGAGMAGTSAGRLL